MKKNKEKMFHKNVFFVFTSCTVERRSNDFYRQREREIERERPGGKGREPEICTQIIHKKIKR